METTYLTAQNARQYRAIMRLFFREYEKMHIQLYKKEDILELLQCRGKYIRLRIIKTSSSVILTFSKVRKPVYESVRIWQTA